MDKDSSNIEGDDVTEEKPQKEFVEFKKPVFIGKLPRKLTKIDPQNSETNDPTNTSKSLISPSDKSNKSSNKSNLPPAQLLKEKSIPLPYKEPKWSGLPPAKSGYFFEVLKSGTILETIDLTQKPFHVFGKLSIDDIVMAHPTISRHHAVIQYKALETEDQRPVGFYMYDLGSLHGTFVNKVRIKPNHYARVRVGHFIKFGCSTRQYILQGPEDDQEEESELSLTEMKQQKLAKKEAMEKEKLLAHLQKEENSEKNEENSKKIEEDGISWGMAEDAEEEPDLTENPFAVTNNEELYLNDPKKTLRGYFEREGVPLEYQCEERGVGQFMCRVELPIEDMNGRPLIAEVIHKGKKKDAVVQCALEACRIIDRHGMLRQAKHESRKRKAKDWKEDDYYDSDEDTFLDRTGAVEKKREVRIKKYGKDRFEENKKEEINRALTYGELVDKCGQIEKEIDFLNKRLIVLRGSKNDEESGKDGDNEDILDQFMKGLNKQSIADKAEISKTKMNIQNLKLELTKMQRLCEIAKPTDLPSLVSHISPDSSTGPVVKKTSTSVIIGKRLKLKNRPVTPYRFPLSNPTHSNDEFREEVDSDDDCNSSVQKNLKSKSITESNDDDSTELLENKNSSKSDDKDNNDQSRKNSQNSMSNDKIDDSDSSKNSSVKDTNTKSLKKIYGPMRPPENYVVPENYFNEDRDLPEITDENDY